MHGMGIYEDSVVMMKITILTKCFTASLLSLVMGMITWWCFPHLYSLMVFSSLVFPTFLSTFSVTQTNSRHQGSRRRQKGSDYTSTSDEEYDSNQSTPKYKRSQPSSASHSPRNQSRPRPQPVVALHPKPGSRDSEEDNPERQTLHNWTNHSVEIARSGILLQMLICVLKMKLIKDSFIWPPNLN